MPNRGDISKKCEFVMANSIFETSRSQFALHQLLDYHMLMQDSIHPRSMQLLWQIFFSYIHLAKDGSYTILVTIFELFQASQIISE